MLTGEGVKDSSHDATLSTGAALAEIILRKLKVGTAAL
jgi:hypothetical protein